MRQIKTLFLLLSALAITSCSYIYGDTGIIKNRDTDYLKATSIAPLNIPPGLSSSTIQAHYPVPDRDYPGSHDKVVLIPPGLNTSGK